MIDTNDAGDLLAVGSLLRYVFGESLLEGVVLRGQIVARHTCTLLGTMGGHISGETLLRSHIELSFNDRGSYGERPVS